MVQALNMPKISKVELPKNIDYTAIGKEIGKSSIELGSNLYFEHQINKAQDKLDNAYSDFQKEIQNNIKEHYDQITQMSNNYNSDINNSRNILRTWCVELSNLQAKSFGLNSINKLIYLVIFSYYPTICCSDCMSPIFSKIFYYFFFNKFSIIIRYHLCCFP